MSKSPERKMLEWLKLPQIRPYAVATVFSVITFLQTKFDLCSLHITIYEATGKVCREDPVLLNFKRTQRAIISLNDQAFTNTKHRRAYTTAIDFGARYKVTINGVEQV